MSEWAADSTTPERLERFIYSSNLKHKDGSVDRMFDNRDELNLFVFDCHGESIDA